MTQIRQFIWSFKSKQNSLFCSSLIISITRCCFLHLTLPFSFFSVHSFIWREQKVLIWHRSLWQRWRRKRKSLNLPFSFSFWTQNFLPFFFLSLISTNLERRTYVFFSFKFFSGFNLSFFSSSWVFRVRLSVKWYPFWDWLGFHFVPFKIWKSLMLDSQSLLLF